VDSQDSAIRLDSTEIEQARWLIAEGVLDATTYGCLRNAIVKAALDEPPAVIVDINGLDVPSASALSVFTSARWHVSTWPDVPILLVCQDTARSSAIRARGVARYVPVYPTREAALAAIDHVARTARRRAHARLPAAENSAALARILIREWLSTWAHDSLTPVACTVATIFIENVLAHTDSAPVLILEHQGDTLTIAVEDGSHRPAVRHEDAEHGAEIVSGLAIVAALSRAWGSIPIASGKTVWAVVGPENWL
jgi:hypothetical protein